MLESPDSGLPTFNNSAAQLTAAHPILSLVSTADPANPPRPAAPVSKAYESASASHGPSTSRLASLETQDTARARLSIPRGSQPQTTWPSRPRRTQQKPATSHSLLHAHRGPSRRPSSARESRPAILSLFNCSALLATSYPKSQVPKSHILSNSESRKLRPTLGQRNRNKQHSTATQLPSIAVHDVDGAHATPESRRRHRHRASPHGEHS